MPNVFSKPSVPSAVNSVPWPDKIFRDRETGDAIREKDKRIAELEARNKELQFILDSDAGDVPELRRRAKADAKRIAELEKEVEELEEERDDFEGQHESAELALEMAEKKHAKDIKGRDERIAELEEALKQEQEEVEDTRATLERKSESLRVCARVEDANLKRIAELMAQQEASHKEIKRMGERSRAIKAELDEKDCELAEVRERMKEMLHLYLAENARANKAGTELLKKLEGLEEGEAREAGEAMMKAMAGTPMVPAEPEVTHIGSINTESASFKRYIASLSEEERMEIIPHPQQTYLRHLRSIPLEERVKELEWLDEQI
jgi:chromosome segregation ATPase